MQEDTRDTIYTALLFSRIAVLLLCSVLGLAWLWHVWRLRKQGIAQRQYQHKMETDVANKTLDLKTLSIRLEAIREDEKARLARELHDNFGGLLTAAKLTTARIKSRVTGQENVQELLDTLNLRLSQGIALKRQIIEDLRPSTLNTLGLKVALETLCADTERLSGIRLTQRIEAVQVGPAAEIALFRIAQEALANIRKHADATEVLVELQNMDGGVRLEVSDNGTGFDYLTTDASHYGLAGMQFRAESQGGLLVIRAAPQQGCRIVATLPASAILPTNGGQVTEPAVVSQSAAGPTNN